jgi:hypothetical protein
LDWGSKKKYCGNLKMANIKCAYCSQIKPESKVTVCGKDVCKECADVYWKSMNEKTTEKRFAFLAKINAPRGCHSR